MPIDSVATRASAYGIPGIEVDGADIVASYEAVKEAIDLARAGGGPSLVELRVERMLPHTTDDDHTRYRSEDEIAGMSARDPLAITSAMLKRNGILSEEVERDFLDQARTAVDAATDQVESEPFPPVDEMYRDVTEDDIVARSPSVV